MARDVSTYLQLVLEACTAIEDTISGISLEEYRNNRAVRSAIQRGFIIIGEALRRLSVLDEKLFRSISNSRAIIDYRKMLAHDCAAADYDVVFELTYSNLIILKAEICELLHDSHDANNYAIHQSRLQGISCSCSRKPCGLVMASVS